MNIIYVIYIFFVFFSYFFEYNKFWFYLRFFLSFLFLLIIIFECEIEKNKKQYHVSEKSNKNVVYEHEETHDIIDLSTINLTKKE